MAHAAALGCRVGLFSCDLSRDAEAGATMRCVASDLDGEGVSAALPDLARLSDAGHSLYLRAADMASGPLMLDDLDEAGVEAALRDGLPALCVAETSPGNHQVWFAAPGPDSPRVRAALLRRLAHRWGGDGMAADPRQVGRLAGVPNTKPGRRGHLCRLTATFAPTCLPEWMISERDELRVAVEERLRLLRERDAAAVARRTTLVVRP